MTDGETARVDILGTKGDEFQVSGQGFGQEGVELALSPEGMLDVPVSSIWNETAFGWGARFGGIRYNKRELVLGFNIVGDSSEQWERAEFLLRRNFSYTQDTTIRVTTNDGTRELKCRLNEEPDQKMERDPRIRAVSDITLHLTAGWPFWTEPDVTQEWTLASGTSASGYFPPIDNPTDMPMYLKYSLDAPAKWVLPDWSFGSDEFDRAYEDRARMVVLPFLSSAAKASTIDTDPTEETIVADDGSQVWALLNGDFLYPVPPETYGVQLPIMVSQASAGASAQIRCERNYLRPWGLGG